MYYRCRFGIYKIKYCCVGASEELYAEIKELDRVCENIILWWENVNRLYRGI